jgi:peptidoglycan/LPS O-acetylase OafA/YrhL
VRDSPNLDFLRAVAVLAVYFAHLSHALNLYNPGSLGRFGVLIFFVHTSCVLMSSLERLSFSGLSSDRLLTCAFWIRRFFRIYPLSIICVLLVPVFHIPPAPHETYVWPGTWHFLSNVALTQSLTFSDSVLAPLWSLPLEVQMYVLLPFLYFIIRARHYWSLGLWIVSVLVAATVPNVITRLSVLYFAPCFVAGLVAFDLQRTARWKLPSWLWPITILLAIVLFGPLDNVHLIAKMHRAWALSLLLGLAIPYTKEMTVSSVKKISHWIAKYSYGIYLSHTIVFWVAIDVMRGFHVWQRAIVLLVGSVCAPIAMYHWIEDPLIKVGAWVASSLRTPPKPVPAETAVESVSSVVVH